MSDSHRALCNDFYINMKLGVKMELPRGRDTVLELFERVRRRFPAMAQFRRYKDELSLETPPSESPHRWLAVRASHVRAGVVNPEDDQERYGLHRDVLEAAPYYLSISPLDIDFVELLFGFDLECGRHHDAIIYEALVARSPLASLLDLEDATPLECQPVLACALGADRRYEAHFEVKSRCGAAGAPDIESLGNGEPISVYMTVRRVGAPSSLDELGLILERLASIGEELVEQKVVPNLLVPLRDTIAFGSP